MLYRETIAVCSEIHTKHINTLYGQSVELLSFKSGGIYSDHWALNGKGKPSWNRTRFSVSGFLSRDGTSL